VSTAAKSKKSCLAIARSEVFQKLLKKYHPVQISLSNNDLKRQTTIASKINTDKIRTRTIWSKNSVTIWQQKK